MSAEMNNKYDVGNFAKLLESFSLDKEKELVDEFLGGESNPYLPDIRQP